MLAIKCENVTLLVKEPSAHEQYHDIKYMLHGFYANNATTLYDMDKYDKCTPPDGFDTVKANEHFRTLVRRTAKEALTAYLEQHREDASIYTDPHFWDCGAIYLAGLERKDCRNAFCDIGCGSIHEDIVKMRIQPHSEGGELEAHYDIVRGAFQESPEAIMRAYYGSRVKYLLATSQEAPYKAKQYMVLEQINAFLKGKQSVTVILKDGCTFRVAPKYSLSASNLISLSGQNRLYLSCDFPYGIENLEKRRRIGNLAALQHGRKILEVNGNDLRGVEYLCGRIEATA